MSLWLVSLTKENWDILKDINYRYIGINEIYKKTMSRVEKGDFIVVYLASKISSFCGLLRVKSKPYSVSKSIWSLNLFCAIDIEPVLIFKEGDYVRAKPLLGSLSFVKNRENWGNHFRKSITEIKRPDTKVFEKIFKIKLG